MSQTETGAPASKGLRIPAFVVAAFATSAIPVGALTTPLLVYLPNYYAALMGISLLAVGGIFALVKLLDIFFDPAVGLLMDRTRTRIGRYRFWLIVGAPIMMLGVWMLFEAKGGPEVNSTYLFTWLVVLYIGYSLLVLSQAAWGAVLATNYAERSRVYAWAHVAGIFGAIAVLTLPSILKLDDSQVVPAMGLLIVCSIPITTLIVSLFVPEAAPPPRAATDRVSLKDFPQLAFRPTMGRLLAADLLFTLGPAITSPLYLFFFRQARGYSAVETNLLLLIFLVAGVFSAPLWAMASARFGKHRTLIAAAAAYSVAQSCVAFIPYDSFAIMAPAMFIAGGILAALSFLIRAMIADVSDEIRFETGKDRTGLLYAMISSTSKIATASAVFITFTILSKIGFEAKAGAVNTPEAMHGLVLIYSIAPVVLVMMGAFSIVGYSLSREKHGAIRTALEARDAEAAALSKLDIESEAIVS